MHMESSVANEDTSHAERRQDARPQATGPLRHTTPAEREHHNRGMASGTDGWRQNIREDRD
jgi:hypothetical protein